MLCCMFDLLADVWPTCRTGVLIGLLLLLQLQSLQCCPGFLPWFPIAVVRGYCWCRAGPDLQVVPEETITHLQHEGILQAQPGLQGEC